MWLSERSVKTTENSCNPSGSTSGRSPAMAASFSADPLWQSLARRRSDNQPCQGGMRPLRPLRPATRFREPPCPPRRARLALVRTIDRPIIMRIGILKCGQSPQELRGDKGDYDTMFERLLAGRGFEFTSYHVENMEFPDSVHAAQGWLLTGSRHGVYADHPFIPPLEEFIRKAYGEHVPMVGICFGHQIIAQALGGKVVKHPEGWAVGA